LLLFQVGPVKCSVFSNDILTIIPPPRQETAGRAGRLPGIFRHNNRIVRVVDMRSKFGLSPSSPDRGRLILVEIPKGLVAFWVDQIINVIDQEEGRWDILPATLPHDVFTRTFVLDEELILHTECPRMEAMSPSAGLTEHIEKLQQEQGTARRASNPNVEPAARTEKAEKPPATQPTPAAKPAAPPPRPEASSERPRPGLTQRSSDAANPAPAAGIETERKSAVPQPTSTPPPASPGKAPGAGRPSMGDKTLAGARPAVPPRPTARPGAAVPERPTPTPVTTPPPPPRAARPVAERPEPVPAARPPAEPPEEPETGEGGGLVWLFLLLLLVFLGGSGALLYFSGFFDTEPEAVPPMAEMQEPAMPPVLSEPKPQLPPAPPVEEAPPPPLAETEIGPFAEPKAEPETSPVPAESEPAPTETPEQTQPPYSANIEKDDQGITITLEGPIETPQESLLKEQETQEPESPPAEAPAQAEAEAPAEEPTAPPATPAPAEQPTAAEPETPPAPQPEPEKPAPARKQEKRVITHVVVKGDTLWDIAERYVKDPYRYPELARLSGIKNPDLIYPGDIVRIIEK
jgi:chemotaxis signal transduction protein/LysM repeat protein